MQIIPAINEESFPEIEKKIKSAMGFGSEWVHLDVSDGKFTKNQLWNNPEDLKESGTKNGESRIKIEVHLMVENPDAVIDEWLDAKPQRIIAHIEAISDPEAIQEKCKLFGAELMLAANPGTSASEMLEYKNLADGFLVLAVQPGRAGQKFGENQLEKIKLLREQAPDAKIIVDGGVNLDNAPQIKKAGADMLVAASAIWGSENPADSYKNLQSI